MFDNLVNMSGANLVGNLLFSSIGFVAFFYGRKTTQWKPMFLGLALMIVPYFVADTVGMYAFGVAGTGALFFWRG
jgi:hypothetical protein